MFGIEKRQIKTCTKIETKRKEIERPKAVSDPWCVEFHLIASDLVKIGMPIPKFIPIDLDYMKKYLKKLCRGPILLQFERRLKSLYAPY
jgi:hypothetical protein